MADSNDDRPSSRLYARNYAMRPLDRAWKLAAEMSKIKDKMPLQQWRAYLYVCLHEGCTQPEIQEACGMAQSAVSRFLDEWGEETTLDGEKGLGLIADDVDSDDRRVIRYSLTRKGKLYRDTIEALLEV